MKKASITKEKNMESSLSSMTRKLESLEKRKIKETAKFDDSIEEIKSRIAEKEIELNIQKKVNEEAKEKKFPVRISIPIPYAGAILKRKSPMESFEEFLGVTKRNDSSEECDYGIIYFCFKGFNVPEYLMEEMFEVEDGNYKIVTGEEINDLKSIAKKYTRNRFLRFIKKPLMQY